jgi:hypothetical protein
MLYQLDYITTDVATSTVEDILLGVDAEAIVAAANWTRADQFSTDTFQIDAATRDLLFDPNGAGAITQA